MGREGLELGDCASLLSLRGIRHLGSGALPLCLLFCFAFPLPSLLPAPSPRPPPPSPPLPCCAECFYFLSRSSFCVCSLFRLLLPPFKSHEKGGSRGGGNR